MLPHEVYGIRWVIVTEEDCDCAKAEGTTHVKFGPVASSEKLTYDKAFNDYIAYCEEKDFKFEEGGKYAVKMICDTEDTGAQPLPDQWHHLTPTHDDDHHQHEYQTQDPGSAFIWALYEWTDCLNYDSTSDKPVLHDHAILVEEANKFCDSYEECELDFRHNAKYNCFNSLKCCLMIECVKKNWLI